MLLPTLARLFAPLSCDWFSYLRVAVNKLLQTENRNVCLESAGAPFIMNSKASHFIFNNLILG